MKKKLFSLLLVFCLALPIGLGLVGCGGSDNSSTSGGGEQQQSQSSGKSDKEVVSSALEQTAMKLYGDEDSQSKTTSYILTAERATGDSQESTSLLSSMSGFVLFMSKVYANSAIVDLDKPIKFEANYVVNGVTQQTNTINKLCSSVDKTTGIISCQMIVDGNDSYANSTTNGVVNHSYSWFLAVDIKFDFESELIKSFTLYLANNTSTGVVENAYYCAKYNGQAIQTTTTEEDFTSCTKIYTKFMAIEGTITLNINLNQEYTDAMNYINGLTSAKSGNTGSEDKNA